MTADPALPPTPPAALALYARMVEDATDQASPLIMYGNGKKVALCPLIGTIGPGGMQDAVAAVLPAIASKMGPAAWLVFFSEAHMRVVEPKDSDEFFETNEPGKMGRDREAGDLDVMECVTITCLMKHDGKLVGYSAGKPFERVGGLVVWGEEIIHQPEGGIPDVLAGFLK